ncbi:MAG: hypothetical protein H6700_03175 [Myxococcales bacterium]|nr:hypothetical protein [Myxococcales bacterium]MCB9530742.1 hypothetical protein [Myxococcales bacterium]
MGLNAATGRWEAAPLASRADGEIIAEVGTLTTWALVELGDAAQLDTAVTSEAWTEATLTDLLIAAAGDDSDDKAIGTPTSVQFRVQQLAAPPAGAEAVCATYSVNGGGATTVELPRTGGKWSRSISILVPSSVTVRYFIGASSACASEVRPVFPANGLPQTNATWLATVPVTTCDTPSHDVCGSYALYADVTAGNSATGTGTLPCPGDAGFTDLNSNGIVDSCEGPPDLCPEDPLKTDPGQCGCGIADTDTDLDGTADCNDSCPDWDGGTSPGPCGCTFETPGVCGVCGEQPDADHDGTPDCVDECPYDEFKTESGQCGCGAPDIDSDFDGTADCNDDCPDWDGGTSPGPCGCSEETPGVCGVCGEQPDADLDGSPDCIDGCPTDEFKTDEGICGCGTPDTDSDFDSAPDCVDFCPSWPGGWFPGPCGCNDDFPGICGVCGPQPDADLDGTPDCVDSCPNDEFKTDPGICGCGTADTDSDSDGTPDCNDGCPDDEFKTDAGVCGCGHADSDTDSDGTPDCNDGCPDDEFKTDAGVCGCGIADTDSDSDGTPDCNDGCPDDEFKTDPGACGCGAADTDSDSDGYLDCFDLCPAQDDPPHCDDFLFGDLLDACISGGSTEFDCARLIACIGPFGGPFSADGPLSCGCTVVNLIPPHES